MWEATSDSYEQQHAAALSADDAMAWGLWRIPEAGLHVLGDVRDKDVLELGCGAARWSIAGVLAGGEWPWPCRSCPLLVVFSSTGCMLVRLEPGTHGGGRTIDGRCRLVRLDSAYDGTVLGVVVGVFAQGPLAGRLRVYGGDTLAHAVGRAPALEGRARDGEAGG
jgi:hypothetical protein